MSVRAESSHRSIPVRERPAYGDSDRVAGRDGSGRSRPLGRQEPRSAHSESPPTFSRDGSCHTDLRARGLLRAACLGFLVKSYAEKAGLVASRHGRANIDAIDSRSVNLGRRVQTLGRGADEPEILRSLERHAFAATIA